MASTLGMVATAADLRKKAAAFLEVAKKIDATRKQVEELDAKIKELNVPVSVEIEVASKDQRR